MRKICHLSSVHFHQDTRILYKECSSLAKNYHTHLIAVNDVPKIINGVKIHTFPKFKSRLFRILFAPILMLYKAVQINAAIYHIHDPELILCAMILKLVFHKKIIFDIHEHIKKHFNSKPYRIPNFVISLITIIYSFIEKNVLDKFDFIITATPLIKKETLPFNKKVEAINNFPILKEYLSDSEQITHSKSVCYIGAITENRGIKLMVDALSLDESFELKLAGSFVFQELENEVKKMKSWKNVTYYGFQNRIEIYDIMKNSFAGLLLMKNTPNNINTFPNKMFEYMLAGIPIIVSDFPLWREILKNTNCAIFVNQTKPEEIIKAMNYLYENPEIAKQMGQIGREKILTDYNWENEEIKLTLIYKELLDK